MDVPDRLYKYRSLDGEDKEFTCRILTHNEVYFASCAKFNDPFDSCPRIDIPKDFAKHKRILKQLYPDWPETRLDAQVLAELQPEKI